MLTKNYLIKSYSSILKIKILVVTVCDASGWLCLVVENLVLLFNDILGF